MLRKNAEVQRLKCEVSPDGKRLICETLVVTDKGEVYEDKVFANIPKVRVKKTKKGIDIDYGD